MMLFFAGCARDLGLASVSGRVQFKGEDIKEGSIQFFTPGQPPTVAGGAVIRDGKYELPREHGLKPGVYLVRISATERTETPPPKDSPAMPAIRSRERIPDKYNTHSTLKVEIAVGHAGPIDFSLD
jgi:hypothetical protein